MLNFIRTRFQSEAMTVLRGFGYLHPKTIGSGNMESSIEIKKAVNYFDIDPIKMDTEVRMLWRSQLVASSASFLNLYTSTKEAEDCFGNVCKFLKLGLTLHLTSCSAEKSFSKFRLVKSRVRSTMAQERPCHLLLMPVESDIREQLNMDNLVEQFARNARRRMVLV